MSSATRRPLASSGSRPSEKAARSRAGTTYALNRGPHSWTNEGSSQVDGWVPSTRACIDRSAARGMLSCRPARGAAEGMRAGWQSLVKRLDHAAVRADLRSREVEPPDRHVVDCPIPGECPGTALRGDRNRQSVLVHVAIGRVAELILEDARSVASPTQVDVRIVRAETDVVTDER